MHNCGDVLMKKVLIVDDTKNIRTLLTMCLESEGYQVTAAGDGKQALELLQHNRFQLVFLDIKLPELPGTEVLRRVRELGINIPIIIMTAFATVKNAVECTKLGAVVYLQKPFTAEKIRRVIQEISDGETDDADNIEILLANARELLANCKYNESFQQLKNALALDPGYGEVYRLLAEVFEAQGESKQAERFIKIAKQFEEG
jgi:two-component system OmpR family response regulator